MILMDMRPAFFNGSFWIWLSTHRNLVGAFGVVVITIAVFANSIDADFVFDDEFFVERNVFLRSSSHLFDILFGYINEGSGMPGKFYRPLQGLTHFLDVQIWGHQKSASWGHHLTNVLLHALLVFAVFMWLRGFARFSTAYVLALFFGLHPLQSEAVAFISGRGDTLAIAFLCLGMTCFSKNIFLALIFATLSMMSKESMALFPVYVLIQEIALKRKLDWRRHLPFWILAGVYVYVRHLSLDQDNTLNFYGNEKNVLTEYPLFRLYTYLTTLPGGLRLWIWPWDLHHERSWSVYVEFKFIEVWLTACVGSVLLITSVLLFKKTRILLMGAVFFLIATVPTSNLFVIINALFYDHWFILPGLGLMLILSWIIDSNRILHWLLLPCILGVTLYWIPQTLRCNAVWNNALSLNEHILKYSPKNAKIHHNYAMALSDRGRTDEAITHYERSIEISDTYPQTHHNLGQLYLNKKQTERAKREFKRALELSPSFFHSCLTLGVLEFHDKNYALAEKYLLRSIQLFKLHPTSYLALAETYIRTNRVNQAIAILEKGHRATKSEKIESALKKIVDRIRATSGG